ncbi:unnamed protein product [Pieris brassicae]|uniref:Uncharacterized protein n=1 Tax=Pieris brassicae TaxID=7116 RepID=A0A9P0TR60_PIEBR|nr:unnamed protein product [Pieris brassicae]
MTSMEQSIKTQKEAISKLENKNYDLLNKNLELRVCAVEQRLGSLEQEKMGDTLEVAGLPDTTPGQMKNVLDVITGKLEVDNIKSTQWSKGPKERLGVLLIKLNSRTVQQQWIATPVKLSV